MEQHDQRAGLQAIMNLATKVVVDSSGLSAAAALKIMSGLRSQKRTIADLEWTRLTRWRAPIAQIFDNPARRNRYSQFHTIEVAHTGEDLPPVALYAGAWFSAPYRADVKFQREEGGTGGLKRITLRADTEEIVFEKTGVECMQLRSTNGQQRSYTYEEPSDQKLMTEELAIIGPDPAFEAAFTRAQELLSD